MKKRKNILIGTALGLGLGGVILFGFLISQKKTQPNTSALTQSTKADLDTAVVSRNISDLDALVQIPNKKDAIVVEIVDQAKIREFDPLFARSYNGDLIIFLPDQTIVFDPVTKTVRDIISGSFYKEVKK